MDWLDFIGCGTIAQLSEFETYLVSSELSITVSLDAQRLWLWQGDRTLREYPVSTAKNGPGEQRGSGCTPRGQHVIRAKIGAGYPVNTVFIGRRPSGELYTPALGARYPDRDWILSRILWLSGLERGKNRLGMVDTMQRYIYIHGCPDDVAVGVPASHGCIRMRNRDIIDLFDRAQAGTAVSIGDERSNAL